MTANADRILKDGVSKGDVPGVTAAATNAKGTTYEAGFGKRVLGESADMTPDTVVWIASMTKAVTGAAAMQLVERGKLSLDRPASEVVPEIGAARVLEGFDSAGQPRLRAPKRPITLRHLLTHTAGYSYEIWSPDVARYQFVTSGSTALPSTATTCSPSIRLRRERSRVHVAVKVQR